MGVCGVYKEIDMDKKKWRENTDSLVHQYRISVKINKKILKSGDIREFPIQRYS